MSCRISVIYASSTHEILHSIDKHEHRIEKVAAQRVAFWMLGVPDGGQFIFSGIT